MELLNKELNLWAKSIGELTIREVEEFAKEIEDFDPSGLSVVYAPKTDQIILYREFQGYECLKLIIELYFQADKARKAFIKNGFVDAGTPKALFDSFDEVIKIRQNKRGVINTGNLPQSTVL